MDREAKLHALKKNKNCYISKLAHRFLLSHFCDLIWLIVVHSIFIFKYLCEDLYRKTRRRIINCPIFSNLRNFHLLHCCSNFLTWVFLLFPFYLHICLHLHYCWCLCARCYNTTMRMNEYIYIYIYIYMPFFPMTKARIFMSNLFSVFYFIFIMEYVIFWLRMILSAGWFECVFY